MCSYSLTRQYQYFCSKFSFTDSVQVLFIFVISRAFSCTIDNEVAYTEMVKNTAVSVLG